MRTTFSTLLGLSLFIPVWLLPGVAAATDYFVAADGGSDDADGSSGTPWLTIQHAADTMQPGDSVTVHAGTYREWIDPPRGGTSNDARIVYKAAEGEQVFIKGSEPVATWTEESGVWKAVIPNTTFGTFNPYTSHISGDYLTYGSEYSLGDVYLNGEAYSEVLSQGAVTNTEKTWFASADGTNTTIWANFGTADPNAELAEVNVRKFVISPTVAQLGYLTFSGFYLMHGAPNWAPPTAHPQEGMVMTNFGFSWIIENNHISDAKTVCVMSGTGTGGSDAIDKVGSHIVRNNTIQRCGQAGIAGSHGFPGSLIENNLIEDINPTMHFGGYESGGIKIHSAIDVTIKGNVIRKIHSPGNGASHVGIWIDWQAQGTRISGNVIYDAGDGVLTLEANHGPILLDNNVFVGSYWQPSENCVWVHNLMIGMGPNISADGRTPSYFTAHTTESAGTAAISPADDSYYNNIYVGSGTSGLPQNPGYETDYNVFYKGGAKSSWGDSHSIVNALDPAFAITDKDDGVDVTWNADTAPTDVAAPVVDYTLIGTASLTGQGIENHDGSPITVDTDITGASRSAEHPTAGPLEASSSANTVTLSVGADGTNVGSGAGGSGAGGSGANAGGSAGAATGSGGAATGAGGSAVGAGGTSGPASGGASGGTKAGSGAGSSGDSDGGGDSGCGCRVGVSHSRSSAWLVALLAGAVLWRRRRIA